MLRRVTWRFWAVLAVILGSYIGLGFWLNSNDTVDYQLYKWGLTVLTFAPAILMTVYAATGNKFWTNDLGSTLAVLSFGITWMAWPLAYTFWFLHGSLGASWVGWCEVSGPALVALAVLMLSYVFGRYHREGNGKSSSEEKEKVT